MKKIALLLPLLALAAASARAEDPATNAPPTATDSGVSVEVDTTLASPPVAPRQSMPSVSDVRGSLQGFSTNISEVVYLAWALKIHSSSSTSSVLPARPLIPWLDEELLCMFPFVNEFGNTNWGVTYLCRAIRYDRSCSNWRRPPDRTCRTEHLITTERPTDSDIAGFIRSSSFGYQDYSFRDTVQVRPAPGASPEIVSALNEKPTDEEISLRRRKHVWMFGRK